MLATKDEGKLITDEMEVDRKRAEYYLLNYDTVLKEYNQAKAEIMSSSATDENGGMRGSMPGHPTEQLALRLVKFDEEHSMGQWLKAVEIVQRKLGERKNIFILSRRDAEAKTRYTKRSKGRPGWAVATQQCYMTRMRKRFLDWDGYVSERTVREWWRRIVWSTVEIYLRLNKKE